MDSSGLYAYKHRGIYYVKYNRWASHPDELGRNLVGEIPVDEEAFKEWLERMRAHYDKEQLRIEQLLEEYGWEKLKRNGSYGYHRIPSQEPPSLSLWIKWVYVFDLDRMTFTVNDYAHFKLNNLPRGEERPDWVDFLDRVGSRTRCLLPTTPREYVADLSTQAPEPSEDGLAIYDYCQPKLISSSKLASHPMDTSEELALDIAKTFIIHFYFHFSNIAELRPIEPWFSHIAVGLLYAASPGLHLIPRDSINVKQRLEIFYFHKPSQFWYRDRLIRLSSHLYIEENLKAEVGTVVKAIQIKAMAECVAILLSVRHVVFVTVSGTDVARTAAIPIIDAFGHGTLEAALQRLSVGLGLLVHYLRPPVYDTKAILAGPSLSLQHDKHANAALPIDVIIHILRFVDDETYAHCSRLSRTYRVYCISRPRVGHYTLLRCEAENRYVARVSDGPDLRIKISWSHSGSTLYPVYIRYEKHGLAPLTLGLRHEFCIAVYTEGEENDDPD